MVMLLLYALGLGIGLAVGLSRDKGTKPEPVEVKIPIGAVVTDHEACSEIGRFDRMFLDSILNTKGSSHTFFRAF